MADDVGRMARPELLTYRPWRGTLRGADEAAGGPEALQSPGARLMRLLGAVVRPWQTAWPIARTSLSLIFQRKLFWSLYTLAMLAFLLFFFGQYLMAWAKTQFSQAEVRVGGFGRADPAELVRVFRTTLKMDGSGETFRNFFSFESYMVMVILALAGSILIGNDLRYGSLPFYLSKPLSPWHYLLGKAMAVAVFINLLTTLPALVLFFEFGLLEPGGGTSRFPVPWVALTLMAAVLVIWFRTGRVGLGWLWLVALVFCGEYAVLLSGGYLTEQAHLALGIVAYGAILTVSLTLILLATATWLQKTVPLILAWATLFFFCRLLANALVDGLRLDARWRLIDLWNNAYLLGSYCLHISPEKIRSSAQPEWYEAALVLGGVSLSCLTYLVLRIRAVEIVK